MNQIRANYMNGSGRKARDSMNRAETTKFLGELLKRDRFRGAGKYWASEVRIDAFTAAGKGGRVCRFYAI